MRKSRTTHHRKLPRIIGSSLTVGVRLGAAQLEQVDAWAMQNGAIWGQTISRPLAIRKLLAKALSPSPR
jgi:hypothetical protein